jgi:hypothetical protein
MWRNVVNPVFYLSSHIICKQIQMIVCSVEIYLCHGVDRILTVRCLNNTAAIFDTQLSL